MKKIYYFILALFYAGAFAQTIPPGESISLDEQLSNINQSSVTSGIIYERVAPLANLYNFNKTTAFNTANFDYFKQVLGEMNRASNGTKFTTIANFKGLISTTTPTNAVDIAILNTQFNILNYNEENPSLGGLTYNTSTNKFVQIAGKVPFYLLDNTVIAATKYAIKGSSAVFKIRNDLFFQNGTRVIKTLVANFDNGTNYTIVTNQVMTNQSITVPYTTTGLKNLTFTVTYTDNTTLTTYAKIRFNYVSPIILQKNGNSVPACTSIYENKADFPITATESFTGYAAGDPTIKAKLNYRVFYANADRKIRKPIIIIDGFDPQDRRKFEDCDCAADVDNDDCPQRFSKDGVFDPIKHRSMTDVMEYYDAQGTHRIIDILREPVPEKNFDVILVNQPKYQTINSQTGQIVTIDGGAYYIESNALALVALIKDINGQVLANGSTSKIAIVGPSMGGQISRYALAYMEKKYAETNDTAWQHNTYLWVSVDSPHLGANIPMGDQAMLSLAKFSSDGAMDFYDNSLGSPAAKQQLLEFHNEQQVSTPFGIVGNYNQVNESMLNAQTVSQNLPLNRGNPYFQQYYNNQNSNGVPNSHGWPVSLRKVAVVNGSLTGSKEAVDSIGRQIMDFGANSEKVLNIRGFQRVHLDLGLGSVTFRIHIASLEAQFMPGSGTGPTRISRFKKMYDDRTTQSPNYNARGNMDNVPGGYFAAQNDILVSTLVHDPVPGINLSSLHNWNLNNVNFENFVKALSEVFGGSEWYLHDFNPINSFVPTFSSLAITDPNRDWNGPLDYNLTCPTNRKTPFDSYFGESRNSRHTSFTTASVSWLLKELAGQPQAPWFPVAASLTGPDRLCNGSFGSYGFSDICKIPSEATWTSSANLLITASGGLNVTVKGLSSGPGFVRAIFSNGLTATKAVYVGTPRPVIQDHPCPTGSQDAPCFITATPNNNYLIFTLTSSDLGSIPLGSVQWQWEKISGNFLFLNNGVYNSATATGQTANMYLTGPNPNPQGLFFRCRMKTNCTDWGDWKTFQWTDGTTLPPPPVDKYFKVSPNPAPSVVQITLLDPNVVPPGNNFPSQLFSVYGQQLLQTTIVNNVGSYYLGTLTHGSNYIIKITVGSHEESHTILVQ